MGSSGAVLNVKGFGMSMKILLVDSDWRFVIKARGYLESKGHLAVSCTAENASSRIIHWKPDLVILAADSADATLMNQINAMPDRPAIVLTEHMSRYDRAWIAWQRGGDELLMKPVLHSEELAEAIQVALTQAATKTRRPHHAVSA